MQFPNRVHCSRKKGTKIKTDVQERRSITVFGFDKLMIFGSIL